MSDWREEQRQRRETGSRALEMFKAAVALLPGAWTWHASDTRDCLIEARREDGLTVTLACNTYHDSKCWCRPSPPTAPDGRTTRHGFELPSAGFSPDRKPEAVAREIARKVVEPYEPMYRQALERFAEERVRRREREVAAAAFAEALGVEACQTHRDSDRATVHARDDSGVTVDLEIYGAGSVKAELRLYGEQVGAFRRFLAEMCSAKRDEPAA